MRVIARTFMFCFCFASLLSAIDYRFVKFDVPGATATYGLSINARGDIVGRYVDAMA